MWPFTIYLISSDQPSSDTFEMRKNVGDVHHAGLYQLFTIKIGTLKRSVSICCG